MESALVDIERMCGHLHMLVKHIQRSCYGPSVFALGTEMEAKIIIGFFLTFSCGFTVPGQLNNEEKGEKAKIGEGGKSS